MNNQMEEIIDNEIKEKNKFEKEEEEDNNNLNKSFKINNIYSQLFFLLPNKNKKNITLI